MSPAICEKVRESVRESVQLSVDRLELAHGHSGVDDPHEREWCDDGERGRDRNKGCLGGDAACTHDGGTDAGSELHECRRVGCGHEKGRGDCRRCDSGSDGSYRRRSRAEDLRGDGPRVGSVLARRGKAVRQARDEGVARASCESDEPLGRLAVTRRDGELDVVWGGR